MLPQLLLAVVTGLFGPAPQASGQLPMPLSDLQGEWVLLGTADAHRPEVGSVNIRMVIKGTQVTTTFFGKVTNEGTVTLGAGKALDMHFDNGAVVQGVYELRDNVLTMCFADAGQTRPTSLAPTGAQWVETWKRAKP